MERHRVEVPRDEFGNHEWKYHVFLSFRGDIRFKFADHLYHALRRAGINTFRDKEELRKGDEIRPALLSAIEDSRISIIVLSKDYASSTWCLDELVKILECRKLTKQVVLPVFYEVDPSEVRHQKGSFGDSMSRHENRYKENIEKVEKWRSALCEVANLSGESYTKESEADFIDKIIQKISCNLGNRSLLHLPEKVVGLESRISRVVSLLCIGKNDVDVSMVGIYGTGGVGKTTIAKAVYNLVAEQFESTCFFADVRDNTTKHGLAHIQQSILTDVLGKINLNLQNKDNGSFVMKERLQKKRVLLVLDNVDKLEQLQSLAGGCDWFGAGSRVIMTTRDKQLLSRHKIEKTYEVEELDKEEALKLLCWNAFRSIVPERGYEDVSTRVLSYARGIPLALEIIGSHLFGKDIEEWESAMNAYKKSMDNDLFGILKLSYESLGYNEKQIFLDVACFLRGTSANYSKGFLDSCGFSSKSGLSILEDKCLVKIQIGKVWMHDLTESMGREIVRRESEGEPGKRSRIWFGEDALQILTNDMGTSKIQALAVWFPEQKKEVVWSGKALKKMVNLRILFVQNAIFSQAPKALPNSLRVLRWENYPSSSLPSNFHGNGLLRLEFLNSPQIVKLQETFNICQNITYLYINNCNSLKEIPDVSAVPYLSTIGLYDSPNLVKIHDSVGSLGHLGRLVIINCSELKAFSAWNQFKSLLVLRIIGCGKLGIVPFGCMQPALRFVCFDGDSLGFQSDGRSRLLQKVMDRQISGEYHVYELGIPRCFCYRSNKNSISFWIQKTLPDVHVSFALKVSSKFDNYLILRLGIGPLNYLHETCNTFQFGTRMTHISLLPRSLAHKDYLEIQEMLIRLDYWVRVDISMVPPESNDRNEDLNAFVEECGIYVSPTCDANFSFVNPYSRYSINNKSFVGRFPENGATPRAIVEKKDDLSSSDLLLKKMMSLEVSPQVKHFAWTAISDHLTSKQRLEEKESLDRCHICGERNAKMAFHFLKNCQWARGVWLLSPLGLRVDVMEANNLSEWMQKLDGILDTESFERFLVIAWGLWCEWDKLCMGLKIEDVTTLIRRMCVLLQEHRITHRSMGQYMLTDADVAPYQPSSQPAGCQDGDQPCQNKNERRKRIRISMSIPGNTPPESNGRNEDLNTSVEACGIYVSPTCDANFSFVDPCSWCSINDKSSMGGSMGQDMLTGADVDPYRPSSQPAGCQDDNQPCQNKNGKRKRSMDKGLSKV